MSAAFKCDRCSVLFEMRRAVPDVTIIRYTHGYGDDRFELCDQCQEELENWLFMKGQNHERDTFPR